MAFSKSAAVRSAARRRRILIAAMGGACENCGATECLEFHHTKPRDWIAAQLNRWQRQTRYEEDWEMGRLQLLCSDCNKRAGAPVDPETEEVSF